MDKIELPPGWKVVKLGEIAQFKNGINFKKEQKGSGILTVDVLNMYSESLFISMNRLYRVNIQLKDDYLLQKNDILFVRSSLKQEGVGWAALFSEFAEPVTFCGFIIRARLETQEIEPIFLVNYLRLDTVRKILISKSGKVGVTNISQASLQSLPIIIPPLPEQKSIAHTLRTIQKAKETRQRELELERERKAALMEYLFTHGTRNEARKQTEIGEIPESWEVVKLGKIACIDMGQSPSGDTYNNTGVGKPLLNGPAEFGLEYPTPVQWTNKPTKICQIGDILFCVRGNTTGKMNIADQEYCIGRGIAAIRGEKSYSNTLFIKYLLQYNISQIYRIALSGGSTFPNIGSRQLKDYPVMYINQAEQKEIAHILKSCDTKIQALEKEISLTDELFHATLEELMTGKLSTKNLIAQ